MQIGRGVLVAGAVVVLAGLDIAGALFARQYSQSHRPAALLLGAGLFVVLFVVYALALEVAELSIVTLGWIVLLQVGLLLIDQRNGLQLQPRQWAAVVLILALQCYLVGTTGRAAAGSAAAGRAAAGRAACTADAGSAAAGPLCPAPAEDRCATYEDRRVVGRVGDGSLPISG